MATNDYDAFISYSHADKAFVQILARELTAAGFRVFFDQTELAVGDKLFDVIAHAVSSARFLLVVMSPDYFSSRWAKSELDLALSQELEHGTVKVIPILRRDCEVPPFLASKMWADFRTDEQFADSFVRLQKALRGGGEAKFPVAPEARKAEVSIGQVRTPLDASVMQAIRDSVNDTVQALFADTPRTIKRAKSEHTLDPTKCFVVMPFGSDDLNVVYEDFVEPTVKACNLVCERGDDLFGSNVVMDDIQRSIESARLVIADLTGKNANVFYEVGIAHALQKPVLLLAQTMAEVPFDLRHRRVLVYEYSPRGCRKLESHLRESINAMLGDA